MPSADLFLALDQDPTGPLLHKGELVYRTVARAVIDGLLAPGTRIPSSRALATDWGIARNTIDDALSRLLDEGLLTRRVGSGTWVATDVTQRLPAGRRAVIRKPSDVAHRALRSVSGIGHHMIRLRSREAVPRVVPFAAGMPDLDLFPVDVWSRVASRRLRQDGRALLGYLPPLGHEPLRQSIARYLATARGIVCDASQLMIVNSSMQALDLIARVLLEKGDTAWVEDPGYPNVRSTLAMTGVTVKPIPLDVEGLSVEHGEAIDARPALIHVSPTTQFPTGLSMSINRRMALLQHADRCGAWVVEDDYAHEFVYRGTPLAPLVALDRNERVLYVGSFTSTMFPSLRLAYVLLPRALVEAFVAVRSQLDDHTHGIDQAVLADFIDAGHFTGHVRRMRRVYRERRDALLAAAAAHLPDDVRLGRVDGGMTAALPIPRLPDDRAFCAEAAEVANLSLIPLSRFSAHDRTRGVLLGFTALEPRAITSAMRRLGQFCRTYRR